MVEAAVGKAKRLGGLVTLPAFSFVKRVKN